MPKVKVKDIPVRYEGERYLKGETVEIDEKHFDKNLFEKVEGGSKKASK